jgi:hypothetical protein
MFYLNVSYRDMEDWLLASDRICTALELERIPDHTTLERTFKKLQQRNFDQLNRTLLDQLKVDEPVVAVGSTGFTPSQASTYYETRQGGAYREYVKGAYAVGTTSQLIVGWRAGSAHTHDTKLLPSLRRQAARHGHRVRGRQAWLLVGDKGFDGRTMRPGDLIPPIRRSGNLLAPERIAQAELVAAARSDAVYGQRWKSETAHAVIKCKRGDTIRSPSQRLQHREPIVKGLVYNLHV